MEESKKTGTSGPVAPSATPGASPATSVAGAPGIGTPVPGKRRQRFSGEPGKDPVPAKSRVRKETATELKFEAIKALTSLEEDGRFFLLFEMPDGKKEVINSWS